MITPEHGTRSRHFKITRVPDVKREALSTRWPWVLLSLIVMACTGALAVPAAWAVRVQVEAERGERAPDAAVAVYLLRLRSGDDGGLRRVLAADRRDELVRQWRGYDGQNGLHRDGHNWPHPRADLARSQVTVREGQDC
jgi:hypothetical protein